MASDPKPTDGAVGVPSSGSSGDNSASTGPTAAGPTLTPLVLTASPGVSVSPPVTTPQSERSSSQSSLNRKPSITTPSSATPHHRQSFAENLRNPPPSPRSQRQPSFNSQTVQGLINHPPAQRNPNFVGRDWRDIALGELVSADAVRWATLNNSVEDCTKTLLRHNNSTGVVLLTESSSSKKPVATFDYSDLNAYLLVVIGMSKPEPEQVPVFQSIAERAHGREAIPIRDIQAICHKDPLATLSYNDDLTKAIEVFGTGARRILVTNQQGTDIVGVLSQLHLVEFFWNEAVNFPMIDRLYNSNLRDLRIGSQEIIAINADSPLADALNLMNSEGLTSVAVVDNGLNVVGNISTRDVQHLTSVSSFPLLQSSCMHFISVILSERGMEEGRDSFPVFYISPHSTLAHTVAKLVATRSHRMWVVDSPSPSPSAPQTPLLSATNPSSGSSSSRPNHSRSPSASSISLGERRESTVLTPNTGAAQGAILAPGSSPILSPVSVSVPAAAMPGAHLSGRLTGVVSLTDILNLFAVTSGLSASDPADIRARRRRSSSSSLRPSLDGVRSSFDLRR